MPGALPFLSWWQGFVSAIGAQTAPRSFAWLWRSFASARPTRPPCWRSSTRAARRCGAERRHAGHERRRAVPARQGCLLPRPPARRFRLRGVPRRRPLSLGAGPTAARAPTAAGPAAILPPALRHPSPSSLFSRRVAERNGHGDVAATALIQHRRRHSPDKELSWDENRRRAAHRWGYVGRCDVFNGKGQRRKSCRPVQRRIGGRRTRKLARAALQRLWRWLQRGAS